MIKYFFSFVSLLTIFLEVAIAKPPTPPAPPSKPITPTEIKGYAPIVISNTSTQANDEVYVILTTLSEVLYLRGKFPGEMATFSVSESVYTPDFSYTLSQFPTSTTGTNDFVLYVPNGLISARIYFSIGNPLFFLNNHPTATISAPQSAIFYDPNFNVLYDFAEITLQKLAGQPPQNLQFPPFIDTTQVDNWSLPIMLGLYTFDKDNPTVKTPYQPAGAPATNFAAFAGDRDTLITTIVAGLTTPWDNLALPFHTDPYSPGVPTTYLRILAPKTATRNTLAQPEMNYTIPQFPLDYLTTPTDFLTLLYTYYAGPPYLYIKADGASNEVYEGVASGNIFTFTSTSNSNHVLTLDKSQIAVWQMYSGVLPFTIPAGKTTPGGDIPIIQNLFGSTFVVGLLGVAGLFDSEAGSLTETRLQDHLPRAGGPVTTPAYYHTPAIFPSASYDLYAENLHAVAIKPTIPPYAGPASALPTVGLCYAYDFDDTLGMSSSVAPPATTLNSQNVYTILILGTISTIPTGVYDDMTGYTLTFTYGANVTFKYRQGTSGAFTTATTNPITIPGMVTSTKANPFQVSHNGHIFNVFPKYQFLQPIGAFTTPYNAVIQNTHFSPLPPTGPTAFSITMP